MFEIRKNISGHIHFEILRKAATDLYFVAASYILHCKDLICDTHSGFSVGNEEDRLVIFLLD